MSDDIRTLIWGDFSAGWCPSDDAENGRKNCLLKMDNLELDKNGALQLTGGTAKVGSAYTNNPHTIYSNDINGSRIEYAGDIAGVVYRNRTNIFSGGATDRAAFGVAFDYALLASGSVRKKDLGTGTAVELGVGKPSVAPVLDLTSGNPIPSALNPLIQATTYTNVKNVAGVSTSGGNIIAFEFVTAAADIAIFQTNAVTGAPLDWTSFTNGGIPTDNDILDQVRSNLFVTGDASKIVSITVDILLVAPGGSSNVVSDYYSQTWVNDGSHIGDALNINLRRGDFTRYGSGGQTWSTVYGFRFTVQTNAAVDISFNPVFSFLGGSLSSLEGTYQYAQMNVNNTGTYLAKSTLSPILSNIVTQMSYVFLHLQNPAGIDAQVNEVWLFRRGGGLNQWYRVAKLTSAFTTPFYDTMSDDDALALGIIVNTDLVSIAASTVTDPILAIVGPIEGRWFYFTKNLMYPSDINDPDLVNASIAVRITGGNDELFMWSKKVADAAVLIGTSHEVYLLTGTFVTLPDGTIDIYLRTLGCKHPPISYDATFYDGRVFYLANDGWRAIDANGSSSTMVAPNTDRLYQKGVTAYGYTGPATGQLPGSVNYPCTIANNKLYCCITARSRIEVYDFTRKYWRNISYGLGDVLAIDATPDGRVTAVFSSDKFQRDIDIKTSNLIDGSGNQTVNGLFVANHDGLPSNRKDLFAVKVKLLTGSGENLSITVSDEATGGFVVTASNNGVATQELLKDTAPPIPPKSVIISFTGSFSQFVLDDIRIEYTPRPTQLMRLLIRPNNFGSSAYKLLSTWPFMIDTLGNTVTFTPKIDGTSKSASVFATTANRKMTFNHCFLDHTYGVDFEGLFTGGPFEFYGMMDPVVLDKYPVVRQIYQVGPIELFKYGKVKQFELRVNSVGSPLNCGFYINDTIVYSQPIVIDPKFQGKDTCIVIPVPKGIEGQVVKILIGNNNAPAFYPFYVRMLVSQSGQDTDNKWITLPMEAMGNG